MPDHKDDALDELKKGFGHFLKAAKSVAAELPTAQIEQAVVSSASEVGRALTTVKDAFEKEVLGVKKPSVRAAAPSAPAGTSAAGTSTAATGEGHPTAASADDSDNANGNGI